MKEEYKHHVTSKEQDKAMNAVRESVNNLSNILDAYCFESREKTIALEKLEECLMWSNKCIALH